QAALAARLESSGPIGGERRNRGRASSPFHEQGGRRQADALRRVQKLERPDEPPRRVQLSAEEPVAGGRRERVMVVVPRLPEGDERQGPVVPRLVPALERLLPEEVADRVDGPGHVMQQE